MDLEPLSVPDVFPAFPYANPYSIQIDLMRAIYNAIEKKHIGIFESPTGTGKTLSIICSALQWLCDDEIRLRQQIEKKSFLAPKTSSANDGATNVASSLTGLPDWVLDQSVEIEKRHSILELAAHFDKRDEQDAKRKVLVEIDERRNKKKHRLDLDFKKIEHGSDEEFVVDAYESADEDAPATSSNISSLKTVLGQYQAYEDDMTAKEILQSAGQEEIDERKVYYTSRTHSQLAQFMDELRKTPFSTSLRVVNLASRKHLCIHERISLLESIQRLNDACLDLQDTKKGCPYQEKEAILRMKDRILHQLYDIEDLVRVGKQFRTCPYYSARHSVKAAQVVIVPYQMLFHKETRESLGLTLENNVVIVDEAHNLVDTLNQIHNASVSFLQVQTTEEQLSKYYTKFKNRLKGQNAVYIQRLLYICNKIQQYLMFLDDSIKADGVSVKMEEGYTKLLHLPEFILASKIDNMNLFKIHDYLEASELPKKLHGYTEKQQNNDVKNPLVMVSSRTTSPLHAVASFLHALTRIDEQGRVVITFQENRVIYCKYILLHPADPFQEIITKTRSVILAGGTMQPVSDMLLQLKITDTSRVDIHSCGHIIPSSSILTCIVETGPNGGALESTFEHRNNVKMMEELGQSVVNLCQMVPGGVVCFFPSYSFQEQILKIWSSNGTIARITKRKRIFTEPKDASAVDHVLKGYCACIDRVLEDEKGAKSLGSKETTTMNVTGALLFCVVGGKLSEGINFADQYGRGVLMIGMPYAQWHSPELQEKMKYMKQITKKEDAGHVYYENLCMRAVNQSIGRAIRHINDYAVIILLDGRYGRVGVQSKLPAWIRGSIRRCTTFGECVRGVGQFFKEKRSLA